VTEGADRYRREIDAARDVARRLRWWAAASVIAGVVTTIGGIVLLTVQDDPWDALNAIVFVGLAGVVGAIAMYASSWSLALSASRLEIQIDGP
jgi:predicted cobalt transporter CbtA